MEDFELLTEEQIEHLFEDTTQYTTEESTDSTEKEENKETTEVDVDSLFTDKPESRGSGNENNEEKEEGATSTKESTSPTQNFYSSIANALVDDGATPDLDASKVTDAESFADAIKEYVKSQLDETQKRIDEALNNGVEPDEIKFYENTLRNLNAINNDFIENEDNEDFRKRAIFQDLINRGFTKEDAEEEVQEILDNGTDIKKAKRAVASMKDFYNKKYKELLDEAKEETAREEKERKERMESFKKDLLEGTSAFGDLELSKDDRKKAFEAISKPVWKDPETGEYYTAIQKYEKENKDDFMKKLAVIFVKTDGFKTLTPLIKGKVNKESKKALRELENTLNNTRRTSDGSLKFASDMGDTESMFKGYSLDI